MKSSTLSTYAGASIPEFKPRLANLLSKSRIRLKSGSSESFKPLAKPSNYYLDLLKGQPGLSVRMAFGFPQFLFNDFQIASHCQQDFFVYVPTHINSDLAPKLAELGFSLRNSVAYEQFKYQNNMAIEVERYGTSEAPDQNILTAIEMIKPYFCPRKLPEKEIEIGNLTSLSGSLIKQLRALKYRSLSDLQTRSAFELFAELAIDYLPSKRHKKDLYRVYCAIQRIHLHELSETQKSEILREFNLFALNKDLSPLA